MKFAYYDRTKPGTPVPESITFGNHCLTIPSLDQVGIPSVCGKLPITEPNVNIGDWVDRGQTLLTARIPVFDRLEPPSKLTFWIDDTYTTIDYELKSPVSGLVINIAEHCSAYYGGAYATSSGKSLCYGNAPVSPILLVPEDEPPADQGFYSFYEYVANSMKYNWRRLVLSSIYGYVRFPGMLHEYDYTEQLACHDFLDSDSISYPKLDINLLEQTSGAMRYIEEMRAHNLVLRKKLQHIGGMAV